MRKSLQVTVYSDNNFLFTDDPAMKELKKIIRTTLDEQINKVNLPFLINTRRYLDVVERYGRQMDVKTALCTKTEL